MQDDSDARLSSSPPYSPPVRTNPLFDQALLIYEGALEDIRLDEDRGDATEVLESAAEVQQAVDDLDLDDAARTFLFCPYECEACEAADFDFAASPPDMYAAICEPLLCAGDDDGGDDECSPKASAARRLFKAAEPARAPSLSCWRRLQLLCCPPQNVGDDPVDSDSGPRQ